MRNSIVHYLQLVFLLPLLLAPSCRESTTNHDTIDNLDIDLIRCYFLSYYQTRNGYGYDLQDDPVAPGADSVNLIGRQDKIILLGSSRESMKPEVIVAGDFLVVDYCDSTMCKLSIIDEGKVVGEGWLPKKATAVLVDPLLESRMTTFYRLQEDLIEKYKADFREKYGLSRDQVDSLVQVTAEKISLRGEVISNDWF